MSNGSFNFAHHSQVAPHMQTFESLVFLVYIKIATYFHQNFMILICKQYCLLPSLPYFLHQIAPLAAITKRLHPITIQKQLEQEKNMFWVKFKLKFLIVMGHFNTFLQYIMKVQCMNFYLKQKPMLKGKFGNS